MKLPDVNLLVHAYHASSPRHQKAREWWEQTLNGEELVGLPWVGILGFIRLTTNSRVLSQPLSVEEAISVVEEWLAMPNVRVLHPLGTHAGELFRLLRRLGTAGNLTTDAHLAAVAIEHECTLYSADTDFLRFPGLKFKNPLI